MNNIEANVRRLVKWRDKNHSTGPLCVVNQFVFDSYLMRKCKQAIIGRRLRRYLASNPPERGYNV